VIRLSHAIRSALLAFAIFTSSSQAAADTLTLHLRNGDRLTGTLVAEEADKITIDTEWQKGLVVPISLVEKREIVPAAPVDAPPPPAVEEAAPPATPPIEPKESFWSRWRGELQFGLDMVRSAKDRDLWHGSAKLTYGDARIRQTFDYRAAYGKTDGILSANRMDGSSKTDWTLSERMYWYNLGNAGYDRLRRIDYQYEVGPGLGHRLLTRTNFVLNVEAGVNYYETGFSTAPKRQETTLRLAEDFTWALNSRLSLEEKLAYTPSLDEPGQYRLRFESTLKFWLMENLSLNLSLLNLFESDPAPGVTKNDLQIRSAVGFKF
jgi:putative salt-induced outer membrane protein YdiY